MELAQATLARIVEHAIRDALADGGSPEARLAVSDAEDSIIVIEVTPPASQAARIVANVDHMAGLVTLVFGRGAVFEVPERGRRYTTLPLEGEIRALSLAVVNGDLAETVWSRNGEPIRVVGEIRLSGRVIKSSWRQMFPVFFWADRKEHIQHAPYGRSDKRR